jgi:hypothetical protein
MKSLRKACAWNFHVHDICETLTRLYAVNTVEFVVEQ